MESCVISSLIVRCEPAAQDKIYQDLKSFKQISVERKEVGLFIILMECSSLKESEQLSYSIRDLEGVNSLDLIYTNFEEAL